MASSAPPPKRLLSALADRIRSRFYSHVVKGDDCWEWQGNYYPNGYGRFALWGQHFRAHRVAWEIEKREIPEGMLVLHSCDNKACVRPDHLWLGTQADNMHDRDAKGRGRLPYPKGSRLSHCKRGHPMSGVDSDVHTTPDGIRHCRACQRITRRRLHHTKKLVALFGCLTFLGLASVSAADNRWSGWSETQVHYLNVYEKCWHKLGSECGRNIVDDDLASGREPSREQVEASSDRMTRWLAPPPPEPVAAPISEGVAPTPTTTSVASAPVTTGASGMPPDYIKQCESGGDYGAVNSSSGAQGAWQILPSTAASYSCDMSTPAGQDECAGRIYSDVGASAWVCG